MIVPLLSGENVVGTIGLDSKRRRVFSEAEIELAETIASQASLAVEKARLYAETLNLTIFNQAVVESIQQGIVVLDRDLVVRRVNSTMAERYGWSNQAIDSACSTTGPITQEFLRQPVAVVLAMGVPQACDEIERIDASGRPSIRNYYVYPMLEGHTCDRHRAAGRGRDRARHAARRPRTRARSRWRPCPKSPARSPRRSTPTR